MRDALIAIKCCRTCKRLIIIVDNLYFRIHFNHRHFMAQLLLLHINLSQLKWFKHCPEPPTPHPGGDPVKTREIIPLWLSIDLVSFQKCSRRLLKKERLHPCQQLCETHDLKSNISLMGNSFYILFPITIFHVILLSMVRIREHWPLWRLSLCSAVKKKTNFSEIHMRCILVSGIQLDFSATDTKYHLLWCFTFFTHDRQKEA